MNFFYCDNTADYQEILNKKVSTLECKHILHLNKQTRKIYKQDIAAGHMSCIWGANRNATRETEHLIIKKMIKENMQRPARITITAPTTIWADNTHTLISWVYRMGSNVKLKDIPIYVIDLRGIVPLVISINNTISTDMTHIQGAISNATRIQTLVNTGLRKNYNWRLKDLMAQLN